jgi:hypothetical protein
MNKEKKKDMLFLLENDDMYSTILTLISDENEKKKIKAFAEDVYIRLLESLSKAYEIDLDEK